MRTAIVERRLDPSALLLEVVNAGNGAAILFIGTVRNVNDGKPVTGMEYSAYRGMAEKELESIAREAVARFDTNDIVVEHRLGVLVLGEVSVVIAVAHPHRGKAYDASRYVIEELKKRVPIWKLEHYVDGSREWVDPTRNVGRRASEVIGVVSAEGPARD
ncbi:MAG TPA: molybdenum cofactor biosynthesis protein MoaE [Gemmatimonadaceae bacterium]|jgi:molybdopterin synthase catalytic subunit|nr:molybdenum cofactor biosynthesis protein MoaE [Gemmatimonadaceae bacterium]